MFQVTGKKTDRKKTAQQVELEVEHVVKNTSEEGN